MRVALQLTFRNSCNSQGHSNLEVVDSATDPGASMDRIIEMSNIDDPHSNADQCNDLEVNSISLNVKIISTLINQSNQK